MTIVVVFISRLEVEANVAVCVHSGVNKPGTNATVGVMRRLLTPVSVVDIGRKSSRP